MLNFNLTSKSVAVSLPFFSKSVSLPFFIQLLERKKTLRKNPGLSNSYQKTNLKPVFVQNSTISLCRFVNFHVFLFCHFYQKQRLEQVFSQIICNFAKKLSICGDTLEKNVKTSPDRLKAFWLHSTSSKNHFKIFFSSKCERLNRHFSFLCIIGQSYSNACCFHFHWMAKLVT